MSMQSISRYSSLVNSVLTDDQIRRIAPSVFAEQAHESRSNRYRFFPTSQVLAGLRDNGFLPVRAQQSVVRLPDRREHTRHMLRLRHADHMKLTEIGSMIPEVVLVNSHDGTSAYQLMAGIFRLVCSNGLVIGERQFDLKVRHSGHKAIVDDVIDASFQVVESFPAVLESADSMKTVDVTRQQATAYATAALTMRYGQQDSGNIPAPIEPAQLIQRRRYDDEPDNVWTTYNVVQENLVRGGIRGRTKTNKRMRTRAINSVTEDVRLNRALWVLAQELKNAVA